MFKERKILKIRKFKIRIVNKLSEKNISLFCCSGTNRADLYLVMFVFSH